MSRRFAEGTSVSVGKSRGDIDTLLRRWGVDGIQWTDQFGEGQMTLQFIWKRDDQGYLARFVVVLPTEDELQEEAKHATSGRVLATKLEKLREASGRREMRALLLYLKGCFEAIEDGIVDAERVLLPFLVGKDGKTFAEHALPQLPKLLSGTAQALLPGPS